MDVVLGNRKALTALPMSFIISTGSRMSGWVLEVRSSRSQMLHAACCMPAHRHIS